MGIEDQLAKSGDAMRSHAEAATVPAASVVLARAQRRRRIGAGITAGVVLLGLGGTAMALRPEPSSQIAVAADTTDLESTTTGVATTYQRPPTTPTGPSTTTTVVPAVTSMPQTTADTTITYETGPTLHTTPDTTVPETSAPDTTVPETTVPVTTVPDMTVPATTVPEATTTTTTGWVPNQEYQLTTSVSVVNSTTLRVTASGFDPDAPTNIDVGNCAMNRIDVMDSAGVRVSSYYLNGTDVTPQPQCYPTLEGHYSTEPSSCVPDCGSFERSLNIPVPGPGTYTVTVAVTSDEGAKDAGQPIGKFWGYISFAYATKTVTVPA